MLLRAAGEAEHHAAFHRMVDAYFVAYAAGDSEAITTMIDFYAGAPGTFAAWPQKVRAYAIETTAVNILDWKSWAGFALSPDQLSGLTVPTLVIRGGASPVAMRRANGLLGESIPGGTVATVEGAAHFMISTHPDEVARLIAMHVGAAHARSTGPAGS
jgi:pimeloyl-ACP methyl ester carboxylesterase